MPPGAPPTAPPPSGWAPAWAPPPAKSNGRRVAIIVGSVVAVLVVFVVAAVVVVRRATPPVSLPDQVGQLSTLSTPDTQVDINTVLQQLKSLGAKHATAKVYSSDGLTVAASAFAGDLPLNDQNGPNVAESFVSGFVTSFTAGTTSPGASTMDPGPNGGFMMCGLRADALESLSFCAWSDGHTFTVVSDTHGTAADAHTLALEIRAADGH
jgi:hypothetical protein